MKEVEGTGITVDRTLLADELTTAQFGDQPGPEVPCRQVGVDMENLPLTGQTAQEGRDDKLRDALATEASSEEEVADVVFGAVDVGVVIHGHEAGQFTADADQERLGSGIAPIVVFLLNTEEAMSAEFQW